MQVPESDTGKKTSSVFFIFSTYRGESAPVCSLDAGCEYKHVGVSFSHSCLKMFEYSCWQGRESGTVALTTSVRGHHAQKIFAHKIYQVMVTQKVCEVLFDSATQNGKINDMVPGAGMPYPKTNDVISDFLKYACGMRQQTEAFSEMQFDGPVQCVQVALRVLVKISMLESGTILSQATMRKIHQAFSRKTSLTPDMLCSILEYMRKENNIVCYEENDGIPLEDGNTVRVCTITSEDFRARCLVHPGCL